MDVDLLKQRKLELGLTNQQLSSLSGVSLGTINKIFSGATQSPRLETVEALSSALGLDFFKYRPQPIISRICEPVPAYQLNIPERENGTYTVEDIQTLPEDVRAELIDGFLIFNEIPTVTHQAIISELCYYLKDYIKKRKGSCKVYVTPIGVREYWIIDPKKKTVSVYQFHENEDEFDHTIYTFESQIPVSIFEDLVIDFKELDI